MAVGRFNEQKGYIRLVEAFEEVYKKNKNVRLHILGKYDTEYGENVINLIKGKKLDKQIILHGVIKNPYPYMLNCDYLVSSSFYEGYPRVINEALSLGKLCIGTDVTGTNEALHNGKMGLLVEDSTEGIIKGMNEVINNKNIINNYKSEISKFDGNKKVFFESLEKLCTNKEKMIIYMPKLSFGGMEKALVNLINYAKLNNKYDLTLYLVYKGDMNYIDLLPSNINLVIACPSKFNLLGKILAGIKLLFRYLYHIFKKYDIAISYSYQHAILCSLTRCASKNNIVYIHSNITQGTNEKELKKRLKKCKYNKFNKIICVSENAKDSLCKLINRNERVYVINNMIDGDNIIEKSKEKIDDFVFDSNKVYFINVCRQSEEPKKLSRIIEVTNKLNKDGYKFEVILIGDGEDHNSYLNEIKKLNIKNIHMLGKRSNPYKYLVNSSALVLSSVREGYPVVFIEAMVLNIPIITTDVSDAKKDIEDKFGIVVTNDDNSIYYGMKDFLDNGFTIKNKFDYLKFNDSIEKGVIETYHEKCL